MGSPRQITLWINNTPHNFTWLKMTKERIDGYGKPCEIVEDILSKELALFYKYGYYKDGEWKSL